jgi:hypothetical protein
MNKLFKSTYREWFRSGNMKILGKQFGVKFEGRGVDDKHILVRLLTEDDETWHETGVCCSSFWIDDLIEVLQQTKSYLNAQEPDICDGRQYGWKFKE